ncbi:hypothetical protein ACI01nite_08840 [Acetobacter cibinongensis]|uniref:Phosphate starvation-inducible protein PsiF n=2 Tax=Acetobacter cibinongensis TaxID=146475 RepID=A0A0D6N2I0_9PROT|nr:hypothetical protein Abci_010_087 [Acetobacter cibinongensis]GBQ18123.1 hypothetical protein AA0482_2136 [Acetobacter cibinongensis NRIC 0482]GEL58282.1 hypothetical protein ACI01nite_08840 [Acetobacter cibinongensis]
MKMRYSVLAFTLLLATSPVYAAQGQQQATTTDPMAGLSMDQQMALCETLKQAEQQNKKLDAKAKSQLAVCHKMDAAMQQDTTQAPATTLDR